MTQTALPPGVVTADPTWFIAASWGISALVLGGLVAWAVWEARRG